jgi:GTP cyclohydrolase II
VLGRTLENYAAQDAQETQSAVIPRTGRKGAPGRARPEGGPSMDARTYGIGAQILFELGVRRLNLLTNHPKRIQGLEGYGLRIVRQSPFLHGDKGGTVKKKPRKKEKT